MSSPPSTSKTNAAKATTSQASSIVETMTSDAEANSRLRSRSVYQGKLKHACGELENAMLSYENESLVLKSYDIASKAFDRLAEANKRFVEVLGSGEELDTASNYLTAFKTDMESITSRVEEWLDKCRAHKADKTTIPKHTKLTFRQSEPESSHSKSSRSSRSSRSIGSLKMEQLKRRQEQQREATKLQMELQDLEDWKQREFRQLEERKQREFRQLEERKQREFQHLEERKQRDSINLQMKLKDLEEQRQLQDEIDRDEIMEARSTAASVQPRQTLSLLPSHDQDKSLSSRAVSIGPLVSQPKYVLVSRAPSFANVRDVESEFVPADGLNSEIIRPAPTDLDPAAPLFHQMETAEDNIPDPNLRPTLEDRASNPESNAEWAIIFANALRLGQELPKLEVPIFNGDPLEYAAFRHVFVSYVDKRVADQSIKLNYLIQHCTGPARALIKHLVMETPERGYKMAWDVLYKRFGRPHVVANSQVDSLINGPSIANHDGEGLLELATNMQRCALVLSNLNYQSDLHNSANILKIMLRLPVALQHKWSAQANSIFESDREPNFHDLTKFVEVSANVANSFYGRNIYSTNTAISKFANNNKRKSPQTKVLTVGNFVCRHACCPYCNTCEHTLSYCKQFKDLSVTNRSQYVRENSRCFICLRDGHISRGCLSRERCAVDGCAGRHHTLLHGASSLRNNTNNNKRSDWSNNPKTDTRPASQGVTKAVCNTASATRTNVWLNILPVIITVGGRTVQTNALLDSGSQVCLCTSSLLNQLSCDIKSSSLSMSTVGHSEVLSTGCASLTVKSLTGEASLHLPTVYAVPSLPDLDDANADLSEMVSQVGDLSIPWSYNCSKSVGLLIGANAPEAFYVYEQTPFRKGEAFATRTLLGWSMFGPSSSSSTLKPYAMSHVSASDVTLQKQLEQFWSSDFVPDRDECVGMSKNDEAALKTVALSKEIVDGHYSLALPFSVDPACLINNMPLASSRLTSLKKRLLRDEELRVKYTEAMEGYISQGHAVRLRAGDEGSYYLPHHAVVHPRKGKVRVVFDCAAEWKGMSLNKTLYTGPDINNDLLQVLLKFRSQPVAIVADVASMFHQVLVKKECRKYLSYLWWPKGDLNCEPIVHQMKVHVFGAKSSPFCASYALQQTAVDFGKEHSSLASSVVLENFYVDDCLISVDNEESAILLQKDLSGLLSRGGFNLTKWATNSERVLSCIPEEHRSPTSSFDLHRDNTPINTALGLKWNIKVDSFEVSCSKTTKSLTRRGLLSVVSSVYDPLGIVVPFTLQAKLLIQDLCRRSFSWDQQIGEADIEIWERWLTELPLMSSLSVPCCIQPILGRVSRRELHYFCDASLEAYCAVAYLRAVFDNGNICCRFILGKSRLAPIKSLSIPRLELSSAVLATKLHSIVSRCYSVDKVLFWSDSTITLHSIANQSKRFKVFTANRLWKISSVSSPEQWRHVPGHLNPADEGTKVQPVQRILDKGRWLYGPRFLEQNELSWPVRQLPPLEGSLEIREDKVERKVVCVAVDSPTNCLTNHFSSFHAMLRAVAWFKRYFLFLRYKTVGSKYLGGEDIARARLSAIKHVQREHFPYMFKSPQRLSKTFSKLSPYVEDGIVRAGGRLSKSAATFNVVHPIILPKDCHFTFLVVEEAHRKHGHIGPQHTWSILRQNYWVVCGGTVVRHVLASCVHCKRRNASRNTQLMGELPASRVTPGNPPFFACGMDFFGPFLAKRARSQIKVYGCIFSCMASRAVHLELTDSLSASSFINVFRRFVARRGCPKEIYCDNGTNFHGAKTILDGSLLDWNATEWKSFAQRSEIQWYFNPPGASHMGGVWERLIRSVKQILYSMLSSQTFDQETLHTFVVEVEGILNARPLVPISMDTRDDSALTPNDLLRPHAEVHIPPGVFDKSDALSRSQWRRIQYLCDQFWSRWSKTYLPLLLPRSKWTKQQKNVRIHDVVIVADDSFPRRCWPLGRIIQVFPDKRGHVRQVDVKFRGSVHRRPISKIVVVESSDVTKRIL